MTRKTLTVRIAMALIALPGVALAGAYALQVHPLEHQLADLPLVRMDPVVVLADRAQSKRAGTTQVANNPASSTLR